MNEETTPPELASDTGDAPLTVSAIEYPEPVGKIFRLDSQHNLVKERPHRPPKAKAIYREFDTFEDFVDWRHGLTAPESRHSGGSRKTSANDPKRT